MGAVQDTTSGRLWPQRWLCLPEFIVLHELEGSHQEQGAHPQQEALESEGFWDIQPQFLSVMGMWCWAQPQTHRRVWGDTRTL